MPETTWTLRGDSSSAAAALKKGESGFSRLGRAVVVVNQALELGAKAARVVGAAYRTLDKYTLQVARSTAEFGDNLAKNSRAMGENTRQMQLMASAAQENGVKHGTFERTVLRANRAIADADRGITTYVELLGQMGIEARGANGELLTGTELLDQMAAAFRDGTIPEGQQAALVMQLLGDRSGRMAGYLRVAAEANAEAADRLERYGTIMSDELLGMSEAYTDSVQHLGEAKQGLANAISEAVLPQMTAFNEAMAESIARSNDTRDAIDSIGAPGGPLDRLGETALGIPYFLGNVFDSLLILTERAKYGVIVATGAMGLAILKTTQLVNNLLYPRDQGRQDQLAAKIERAKAVIQIYGAEMGAEIQRIQDSQQRRLEAYGRTMLDYAAALSNSRAAKDAPVDGGGGGPPPPGGDGVGEGIAPSEAAGGIIDISTTTTEAADMTAMLSDRWSSVAEGIYAAGAAMKTLTSGTATTGQKVLGVLQMVMQLVSQFGGPMGGAIGGIGSSLLGLLGGIGDRGLWPEEILDRGSPRLPNTGLHHSVIKRRDEMVLDPVGTTILHRSLRFSEEAMRRAARGGGQDLLGRRGGESMSARIPVVIQIGTTELMREITTELELDTRSGRGPLASSALVTE